jgi:hypothetical protein
VEVESYAVVGHYILLSIVRDPFTDQEAGTVAFDTITDKRNAPVASTCNEELEMDDIYMNIHRCVDAEEESKTQWPGELVLSNKPAMYACGVQEPIYHLIAIAP